MTKLFTQTDLERAARLATTKLLAGTPANSDASESAVADAVKVVAADGPAYYSEKQLEDAIGEAYEMGRRDVHEGVCDPVAALYQIMEMIERGW